MKMVLIKYKKMSVLVDQNADMNLFIQNLDKIQKLDALAKGFYKNLLTTSPEDLEKIEKMKSELKPVSDEMKIIGTPFDNHDAELYALDHGIEYGIFELHGNTSNKNAKKEKKAETHIQIRITKEKKEKYSKQAKKEHLSLSKWILKQCDDYLKNAKNRGDG